LPIISRSGFGASRLPQDLGTGQRKPLAGNMFEVQSEKAKFKEGCHRRSGGIPEDCNEVTGCPGDNEQMPDEVGVAHPLGREESHSHRVGETTRQEP